MTYGQSFSLPIMDNTPIDILINTNNDNIRIYMDSRISQYVILLTSNQYQYQCNRKNTKKIQTGFAQEYMHAQKCEVIYPSTLF